MALPYTRTIAVVGASLLLAGGALLGASPAYAGLFPVTLQLEIAGPDGVFVPVASGEQFAVSSVTATTARWTLGNPAGAARAGFYLYSYGPDCAVSGLTIDARGTYVCTEAIPPEALQAIPAYGPQALGALGGYYDGMIDTALPFPLVVDIVDDSAGQSMTLSQTTVSAEGTIVITGSGFDDDDELTGILTSTPVPLGAFPLTGGAFSYTLTLPAGFDPGVHTITVYSNGVAYAARTFTLLGGPELSATGVDTTAPLLLSGSLFGVGLALLLSSRPRSRRGRRARPLATLRE